MGRVGRRSALVTGRRSKTAAYCSVLVLPGLAVALWMAARRSGRCAVRLTGPARALRLRVRLPRLRGDVQRRVLVHVASFTGTSSALAFGLTGLDVTPDRTS